MKKQVDCPSCEQTVMVTPHGHVVHHYTRKGRRCKNSGAMVVVAKKGKEKK